MPGGTDPGSGGDPYVYPINGGEPFQFWGEPGKRYTLYKDAEADVSGRLAAVPGDDPHLQCYGGFDVVLSNGWKVVVMGGKTHVVSDRGHHIEIESKHCTLDAPGHLGCTTEADHPLKGVPHLNMRLLGRPASDGASGLCVEGRSAADHVHDFIVQE